MEISVDISPSNLTPTDEQILLRDFRRGSTLAMKRIFHLHWKTQVFFARRFVPEAAISEDIVSEVFVKLWARREGFASLPSIRAFLYIATRNACLDHLRKDKRVRQFQRDYSYLEKDIMEESELTEVMRAELVSKVMGAIDLLPNQYRKVMRLSTQGLGTEEIAQAMNLSPKIVRNYKARAINILKKDLLNKSSLVVLACLLSGNLPW
jgi:RNA polymerase sigma-70 factor (family 1)